MSGDHCRHCGDNCGDDSRTDQAFPQTLHTDEVGVFWRPGCCPYRHLTALAVARLEAEQERVAPDGDRHPHVSGYLEALDFATDTLRELP